MSAPDPIDVHVGHRLRNMRKACGMSLSAVGSAVGVSYQQAQKYESGHNRISASMLWRIAGVLDVDIGFFFEGLDLDHVGEQTADAEAIRISVVLSRLDPVVRHEIRGLIDALVATAS